MPGVFGLVRKFEIFQFPSDLGQHRSSLGRVAESRRTSAQQKQGAGSWGKTLTCQGIIIVYEPIRPAAGCWQAPSGSFGTLVLDFSARSSVRRSRVERRQIKAGNRITANRNLGSSFSRPAVEGSTLQSAHFHRCRDRQGKFKSHHSHRKRNSCSSNYSFNSDLWSKPVSSVAGTTEYPGSGRRGWKRMLKLVE